MADIMGSVTYVDEDTEFHNLADRVFGYSSNLSCKEIEKVMKEKTGWTFIGVLDGKKLWTKLMKHLRDKEHIELTQSRDAYFIRDADLEGE